MGLSAAGDTRGEIRWLKSHHTPPMCHPRVSAWWLPSEKGKVHGGAWVACCFRGSFQEVDQVMTHLMVGSLAGVEVVIGKFHRKIFSTAARGSDDGGRFRSFL